MLTRSRTVVRILTGLPQGLDLDCPSYHNGAALRPRAREAKVEEGKGKVKTGRRGARELAVLLAIGSPIWLGLPLSAGACASTSGWLSNASTVGSPSCDIILNELRLRA